MRALTRRDLSRFLRSFARQLPCPTTLILTGGSEALVLGGTRPTADIDGRSLRSFASRPDQRQMKPRGRPERRQLYLPGD